MSAAWISRKLIMWTSLYSDLIICFAILHFRVLSKSHTTPANTSKILDHALKFYGPSQLLQRARNVTYKRQCRNTESVKKTKVGIHIPWY